MIDTSTPRQAQSEEQHELATTPSPAVVQGTSVMDLRSHGKLPNSLFLVDSRFRGNDGKWRPRTPVQGGVS